MKLLFNYIIYLFRSQNLHGIHSPFVYKLTKEVIYNKRITAQHQQSIEKKRRELIKDNTLLSGSDLGAGSSLAMVNKTFGQFAKASSKSKKYSQLLFRLANWRKPHYAIELGTALGISAMYQSSGFEENTMFISMEGNEDLAEKAYKNFNDLHFKSIELVVGNFDQTLPSTLEKIPRLDWVFFDGNHKKEPTLRYFNLCIEKASNHSLFIVDDIHWSAEMREAWNEIKQNPKVSLSIDLFYIGLVFFDHRFQKEHFVVRF